tara:strand:+ start:1074 stop:1790 length:717 start_codon:yes stop_codon:yes gene_type:complete
MHEIISCTWAERAQAELGAAQRFRTIAKYLEEYDTPKKIVQIARKAALDEERHAFLCAKVAIKWGHKTGFKTPESIKKNTQPSWNNLPSNDAFLLDIVLMCCITESFNASLLNSMYAQSKQSEEGRIIHQILKDEVQHAQLGWAFLQFETQKRDCSFVSHYLVDMLNISIRDELFSLSHRITDASTYIYGVMPHQDRLSQFQTTLEEVICPGFTHFGIDVTPIKNWIDDKSSQHTTRA